MKVFLILVSSVDGIIAKETLDNVSWSSREDKAFFARKTKRIGCVIMGENTFRSIGKSLKDRLNIVLTQHKDELEKEFGYYDNVLYVSAQSGREVLNLVEANGYKKCAIIGGQFVNSWFMKENLIDYVYITIESLLFGKGLTMFNFPFEKKLNLLKIIKLSEKSVVLKYKVL